MIKRCSIFSLLFAVLLLMGCAGTKMATNSFTIVNNKSSDYAIVLPAVASVLEKTAAKEIQEYLFKATDKKLEIVSENSNYRKGIFIGNTAFAQKHGIIDTRDEAWIFAAADNNLVINGGKLRGVLYGVYHFLEDVVGVRWWDPWEEDVPKLSKLNIPANFISKGNPTFAYRDLYDGLYDDMGTDKKMIENDHSLYQVRNRLNGHFSYAPVAYGDRIKYGKPYHVHTFNRYFNTKKYFALHPEWYAWSKAENKRIDNGQMCLSNKKLLEAFKQKVKDSIQASYQLADERGEKRPSFFSVSFNDTKGICECDDCVKELKKKGTSGYTFSFVNKIAAYIAPIFPDAKIETLAYWAYRLPPLDDTKPAKNVVIRLAEDDKDNMHSLDNPNNKEIFDRLKVWTKLCDNNNLYIWDYYLNYENMTNSSQFRFERDMQIYKQYNAQGLFGEIEWPIVADMWNLRFYMLAKLYENNQLKTDDLIFDFTNRYYGAAAKPIRDFLYLIKAATDKDNTVMTFRTKLAKENFVNLDLAIKGNRLFEEALQLVKNNTVLSRRVRHARSYFDKIIVHRNAVFESEAKTGNKKFSETGLDKIEAAKRIVSVIKEQGAFKVLEERAEKELKEYARIASVGNI